MRIIRQLFLTLAAVLVSQCVIAQEPATAEVTRGSSASSVVYEGYIEAVTETSIAAQVAGVIEQIEVSAGDQVRAGQVLLQIDALWCSKEKHVRLLSLIAVPWWLIYNGYCSAWGSVAGDLMSLISLVAAMLRYDLKKVAK